MLESASCMVGIKARGLTRAVSWAALELPNYLTLVSACSSLSKQLTCSQQRGGKKGIKHKYWFRTTAAVVFYNVNLRGVTIAHYLLQGSTLKAIIDYPQWKFCSLKQLRENIEHVFTRCIHHYHKTAGCNFCCFQQCFVPLIHSNLFIPPQCSWLN